MYAKCPTTSRTTIKIDFFSFRTSHYPPLQPLSYSLIDTSKSRKLFKAHLYLFQFSENKQLREVRGEEIVKDIRRFLPFPS